MSLSTIVLSLLMVPAPQEETIGELSVEADDGPPAEAIAEFRRGRELYASAQYEEALAAFQQADSLHPAADLQYNIALCHMRLEHWAEAIAGFEIYLRTKQDPPDRADVEARIAEARRHLARAEEPVTVAPPSPAVSTDVVAAQTDSPPAKPWIGLVASGGVMLGVGAAAAVGGGAGFGIALSRKNDELDTIVNGGNPQDVGYAEAQRLEQEADRLRTLQWVSVGVGSGVAVTGAVLLGIGVKRRRNIAVAPTGRGIAIGGRF